VPPPLFVSDRRFGVSTHLFHASRLTADHLVAIRRAGFAEVELCATRSHFDYTSPAAVADLGRWLAEQHLTLRSVHAPVAEAVRGPQWVAPYSTAAADEPRRRAAVAEVGRALTLARSIPYRHLVLHLGVPETRDTPAGDNHLAAARRSLQEIAALAREVNVTVAVEVLGTGLSSAATLVRLLEEDLDLGPTGICLDLGHAHLRGDVVDTIETVSGHVVLTHLHDNAGRRDDHLVPGQGTIDWDATVMALQKLGYDDVLIFEPAAAGDAAATLRRCSEARQRLERLFVTF